MKLDLNLSKGSTNVPVNLFYPQYVTINNLTETMENIILFIKIAEWSSSSY